jgi:UDP-N-acetylglucosamine acyltransferase
VGIHPTAIIDRRAEIDPSAEIGPFCVIEENVRVGAGCRLYQGVYLTGWTQIGPNCELHPHVIVGHSPQDTKYHGERSYCRIGRGTILRENVTIHRGTIPDSETIIGEDCFFLGGTHVGHNCVVGNRVTLINNVLLAGHVEIADLVTIGGAAAVHQFVRIGELAMITGNARVAMDVPPFMMIDVEGRVVGLNRVGIRRAELPREEVAEIRDAFRTLYGSGLLFRAAVEQLSHQVRTPSGVKLLQFVQKESRRGIAGRTRRGGDPADG